MTTISIPKTEYKVLIKIAEISKKQSALGRILESVQDQKNGNITKRSKENFMKNFNL